MALTYNSKVAQPAHRVKDKRLRRAFGILDTARWLDFMTIKGLLPTPVEHGLIRWSLRDNETLCAYLIAAF